jgi:hypothetical protein
VLVVNGRKQGALQTQCLVDEKVTIRLRGAANVIVHIMSTPVETCSARIDGESAVEQAMGAWPHRDVWPLEGQTRMSIFMV